MKIFQIESTDFDLLLSSHLNDPRLLSAFKIIVFCWKLKDSLLICEKCCREISIDINHLIFDPISSHRAWCPILKNNQWKQRIEQIENILYKKSRRNFEDIKTNTDVNIFIDFLFLRKYFFYSKQNIFFLIYYQHKIYFMN